MQGFLFFLLVLMFVPYAIDGFALMEIDVAEGGLTLAVIFVLLLVVASWADEGKEKDQ